MAIMDGHSLLVLLLRASFCKPFSPAFFPPPTCGRLTQRVGDSL